MSNVERARTTLQGNVIINEGDVIVQNPDNGIVMTDQLGDESRLKVIDDNGVKTFIVEEIV